jgi:phosphoribosyl 1,2-cyclic phosphodiesterase
VLASSSSGNCAFIGTERTRILVDAGLSRKETFAKLQAIGEDPDDIDAVLITHEHSDHVSGLVALARKLKDGRIPIFLSRLTAPTIDWSEFEPTLEQFQAGSRFRIGDIEVDSFTVPHDATDPCGFCFRADGVRIGVVTDLGYMPESVKIHLRGTDLLLLESNHDVEMLKVGPYPWSVKQRVMGRKGHLSNDIVSDFLRKELDTSVSTVVLGHLSEQNNHPEIVRLIAEQALNGRLLFTRLVVAEPKKPTEIFQY